MSSKFQKLFDTVCPDEFGFLLGKVVKRFCNVSIVFDELPVEISESQEGASLGDVPWRWVVLQLLHIFGIRANSSC